MLHGKIEFIHISILCFPPQVLRSHSAHAMNLWITTDCWFQTSGAVDTPKYGAMCTGAEALPRGTKRHLTPAEPSPSDDRIWHAADSPFFSQVTHFAAWRPCMHKTLGRHRAASRPNRGRKPGQLLSSKQPVYSLYHRVLRWVQRLTAAHALYVSSA